MDRERLTLALRYVAAMINHGKSLSIVREGRSETSGGGRAINLQLMNSRLIFATLELDNFSSDSSFLSISLPLLPSM